MPAALVQAQFPKNTVLLVSAIVMVLAASSPRITWLVGLWIVSAFGAISVAFIIVVSPRYKKIERRIPVTYSVARRVAQRVRALSEELVPAAAAASNPIQDEGESSFSPQRLSMQVAEYVLQSAENAVAHLLTDSHTRASLRDEVVRHLSISEAQEGDLDLPSHQHRSRRSTATSVASTMSQDERCRTLSDVQSRVGMRRRVSREALPSCHEAFLGTWRPLRSVGYSAFLQEVAGLPWAVRKIAERMPLPSPIITVDAQDGKLHCETVCVGAKPVREVLEPGESIFFEPNLNCEYKVTAIWEGAAFVATRKSEQINKGRPTEQRRWVDTRGVLVIQQSWGGQKDFVAEFVKA